MSIDLSVFINANNARVICIGGKFADADSIRIFRSLSPTEDFDLIAELFGGECSYTDYDRLTWNKGYDLYYKAALVRGSEEEYSCTVRAANGLVWPYNNTALALIKAADTEIKQNGREGILLKAKEWGEPCPRCSDFGTDRPLDEHCPVCFGVGKKGGYYEGMTLWILDDPPRNPGQRTPLEFGEGYGMTAKCIAYPVIQRADIWVGKGVNDRYFIEEAAVTSAMKGVPITYGLSLRRIEQSDVIYTDKVTDLMESAMVDWDKLGR